MFFLNFEILFSFVHFVRKMETSILYFLESFFFIFIILYSLYITFLLFIKSFYFFNKSNGDLYKIKELNIFNLYTLFYLIFLFFFYIFSFIIVKYKKEFNIKFFLLFDNFYFEFLIDNINLIFCLMIDIISLLIILYSTWYMYFDKKKYLFIYLLYHFSLVMKLLIYSNSCLTFLICWEFVGLFSFLLISFWCNRIETRFASLKAFILNKVGDLFLLLAVIIIIIITKIDNISILKSNYYLFLNLSFLDFKIINVICLFFLIAALIKSAQFLFHIWLFDAMEGPTPVSALLHAATMVTAGVILILKFNFFFFNNIFCNYLLNFFGIFSGIFGGIMAVIFFDIKKIIAGSTCSQIGLMMMALSCYSYMGAAFHLFTHAFFKALLFLTAGIFIHSKNNEQDLRKLEGLFYTNPMTTVSFFIASFALMGFPYTSGYFSKDFIFESFFLSKDFNSFFNIYAFILISSISCYYSYKIFTLMLFKSFWHKRYFDKKKLFKIYYFKDTYNNLILSILCIFNLLVIFSGFFIQNIFKINKINNINYYLYDLNLQINSLYFVNKYFFIPLIIPFATYIILHFLSLIKRYFYMHYFWTALFYFRRIDYRYYIDELADVILKIKVLYFFHFYYKFFGLRFYIDIIYIKFVKFFIFSSYYTYIYIERGFLEHLFQILFVKYFIYNLKDKLFLIINNYKYNYLRYFIFIILYILFFLLFYFFGFLIYNIYLVNN